MNTPLFWVKVASFLMFIGVGCGAFGAHALKHRLDADMMAVFKTAVEYHFIHALAIFVVSYATTRWESRWIQGAGWFFLAGILLFSGSLYCLSLTGVKAWGAITPIGGLAFLLGWLCLFLI